MIKKEIIEFCNNEGIHIATAIFSSIVTILLLLLVITVSFKQDIDGDLAYRMVTGNYNFPDDVMVNITLYKCNQLETDIEKAYCVNDLFNAFFVYTDHETKIRTPTKTLMDGGVCRDAVVYYCSVFEQMNIKCDIQSTNNHVFNIIYFDDRYCIIDQNDITCN